MIGARRAAPSPPSACRTASIEICAGDLGQSHHRSFDIEVYAPGADAWLEVSSISWFSDYQARRANIRFRRTRSTASRKGTEIAHTLNGSALAVPRVWAAIVENYRQPTARSPSPRCCSRTCAAHTVDRGATVTEPASDGPCRADAASRPPGAVRDGRPRRRRRRRRPDRAVAALVRRRRSAGVRRAQRHDRSPRSAPTAAPTPAYVLVRGADERGFVFYTNYDERQEPPARRQPPWRRRCSRGSTCTARSACAARCRAGVGRRERRLLRVPAPRQPARRLGVAAERRARRSGASSTQRVADVDAALRRASTSRARRTGVAGGSVRRRGRVLAGPAEPPARPRPLPPRRRHRHLDRRAAGAVIGRAGHPVPGRR